MKLQYVIGVTCGFVRVVPNQIVGVVQRTDAGWNFELTKNYLVKPLTPKQITQVTEFGIAQATLLAITQRLKS